MTSRQPDEVAIFRVAGKIDDPHARAEYLDQVCSGDSALRERVLALLDVREKEQDLLRSSPEPASTVNPRMISERPGTAIGRYKLMEQIGEGGMGVVFVAEQVRPIRRKVALKVIKPGMDSRAVVARFEAERQALVYIYCPRIK